jgi:hypothetical protein
MARRWVLIEICCLSTLYTALHQIYEAKLFDAKTDDQKFNGHMIYHVTMDSMLSGIYVDWSSTLASVVDRTYRAQPIYKTRTTYA